MDFGFLGFCVECDFYLSIIKVFVLRFIFCRQMIIDDFGDDDGNEKDGQDGGGGGGDRSISFYLLGILMVKELSC